MLLFPSSFPSSTSSAWQDSEVFFSQPFLSSICLVLLRAVCPSLQGRDFPLVSNVVQFGTAHIIAPGQGEVLHATARIC